MISCLNQHLIGGQALEAAVFCCSRQDVQYLFFPLTQSLFYRPTFRQGR